MAQAQAEGRAGGEGEHGGGQRGGEGSTGDCDAVVGVCQEDGDRTGLPAPSPAPPHSSGPSPEAQQPGSSGDNVDGDVVAGSEELRGYRPRLKLEVLTQGELDGVAWLLLAAVLSSMTGMMLLTIPSKTVLRTVDGNPRHYSRILATVIFELLFLAHSTLFVLYCRSCFHANASLREWDHEQVWTAALLLILAVAFNPVVRIWLYIHNFTPDYFAVVVSEVSIAIVMAGYYGTWLVVMGSYQILTPTLPAGFYCWKVVTVVAYAALRIALAVKYWVTTFPMPMATAIPALRVAASGVQPSDYRATVSALVIAACDTGICSFAVFRTHQAGRVLHRVPLAEHRAKRLGYNFFIMGTIMLWALAFGVGSIMLAVAPITDFRTYDGSYRNFGGLLLPQALILWVTLGFAFTQAHVRLPAHRGAIKGWFQKSDPAVDMSQDLLSVIAYSFSEPQERTSRPHFALNTCALAMTASLLAYRTPGEVLRILQLEQQQQQHKEDGCLGPLVDNACLCYVGHVNNGLHTTAYLFKTSDSLLVAFRGTASLEGVRTDLKFPLIHMDSSQLHLKRAMRVASHTSQTRNGSLPSSFDHGLTVQSTEMDSGVESAVVIRLDGKEVEDPLPASQPTTAQQENEGDSINELTSQQRESAESSGQQDASRLRVHRGFYASWQSVAHEVATVVAKHLHSVQAEQHRKTVPLLICGHSLGGALAMLAAYDLQAWFGLSSADITVYTFGGPRVGDHAFARAYDLHIPKTFRVVLARDLVTKVPPPWKSVFGFKHVGRLVLLDERSDMLLEPSFAENLLLHGIRLGLMRRHLAQSYVKAIRTFKARQHALDNFSTDYPWNGGAHVARSAGSWQSS